MRSYKRTITTGLVAVLAAACGGGGNGSSPEPPDDRLAITSANAPAVAGTVLQSVVAVVDLGSIVDAAPVATTGPVIMGLKSAKSLGVRGFQAAIGPETLPCAVSGTVTLSGNLADPYTLSPGDSIIATFDTCDDGVGVVIDGAFDGTVVGFSGDTDLIQARLTMDVDATALSVTVDGETVTTDGGYTFTVDTLSTPVISLEVSGDSLRIASPQDTITLENFSEVQTQNLTAVPRPITFEAGGSLTSAMLGGRVEYSTPLLFEAFDDDYPYTGEMLIMGANDSSVRFVALNQTNVRLNVDPNGDGAVESTIDSLWDDMWQSNP
jgi:hypothetical protein